MYPSSSENLNKETEKEIHFFTPAFHPLDPFSAHRIDIWDKSFPTAEHAFQWKKFSISAPRIAQSILDARSPEMAHRIAKQNKANANSSWHDEKVKIMKEIFQAKLEQNIDVQEILAKTGNRVIIENSPIDSFWGSGAENDGQNMIGKIWMEMRSEFDTKA